jgi:hypothetical protein
MGPLGHFAIGLAAKPSAPIVPIWVFLLASWLLDLLGFLFQTLGFEDFGATEISFAQGIQVVVPASVPWSHGLLISIVWSVLFGIVIFLIYRDQRTSVILGLAVFSHWILDFIVHLPDLPLLFMGSQNLGLGLWGSGPGLIASVILELSLFAGGLANYLNWRKGNIRIITQEQK